jgi:hypothetical protein
MKAINKIEKSHLGMTIGFKVDTKEVIIEAPLDKDKGFMTLNNLMLLADGTLTYTRRMFETINGKKLRQLLTQKYQIEKFHEDSKVKPHFLPMGLDFLAVKRARLVNYLDDAAILKEEQDIIYFLKDDDEHDQQENKSEVSGYISEEDFGPIDPNLSKLS